MMVLFFFFQAEDGIRDLTVTGVQTCALPIYALKHGLAGMGSVLPPDDEQLFKERMHAWSIQERPNKEVDTYLVATAVLASVRIDRCARNEFAAIAKKRREAIRNWQRRQDRRIDKL